MGSDVPAEVSGAMVVSSSSDLDYLLWATTLFGSIYVIMYIFRILLVFLFFLGSVVISTKLFIRDLGVCGFAAQLLCPSQFACQTGEVKKFNPMMDVIIA